MAKRPPSPVAAPVADLTAERQARRRERQRTVADVRRALMLDAARAAFFELGLEGASIREIAKRAGYTPGAIYSYFVSKEEIYGALLGESLERLNAAVAAAVAGTAAEERLRTGALAFYGFYREQPRDLDLGFYLFRGMQPRGLTPELNRHLNSRLRDALAPCQEALRQMGLDEAQALAETTALFAHIVGLLVLSHTGRIRMFRQATHELFARYLDGVAARARPHAR